MKNIYRETLKKAWTITKENKILWIFGLFVALLGNGGEYQVLINVGDRIGNGAHNLLNSWSGFKLSASFNSVYQFLAYNPLEFALVLMAGFALLFLIGFLLWMVMVSQGALIDGANKATGKKKFNFNEGIGVGMKNFAPILGISVLSKALVSLVLFGAGIPLLFLAVKINSIASVLLALIFFIVLISLAIVISFIAKYASAFVVLKNRDFLSAVKDSFKLFCDNWIVSLEMAFILFLINIVVGIFVVFAIALVYIPLATASYIYFLSGFAVGAWFMIIVTSFITLGVIGFVGALLATFQWASWITLFKKLNSRETVFSKIERTIVGFPKWVKEHI